MHSFTNSIASKRMKQLGYPIVGGLGIMFISLFMLFSPLLYLPKETIVGIDIRTLAFMAQLAALAVSNFIGMRFLSGLSRKYLLSHVILFGALSFLAIIFIPFTSAPINILFAAAAAFPIGFIWGLVYRYVEKKKYTPIVFAVICIALVVGPSLSVSLSEILVATPSSPWDVLFTNTIGFIGLFLFALIMEQTTNKIKVYKVKSKGDSDYYYDNKKQAKLINYPEIFLNGLVFMSLIIFKIFKDGSSINALGGDQSISLPVQIELLCSIPAILLIAIQHFIKGNRIALVYNYFIILIGIFLVGISSMLYFFTSLSSNWLLISSSVGFYIAFLPMISTLFEKMMPLTRFKGSAVYLVYFLFAWGYLGGLGVMILKTFVLSGVDMFQFYTLACYLIATVGVLFTITIFSFFWNRLKVMALLQS